MPMITPETLTDNFIEIATGFSEEQALDEAGRCLQCGSCSECLVCMDVCRAKAVDHLEPEEEMIEHAGVLILADPGMIPQPVKGTDIIRVYSSRTTRTDVYAMILRGFAAAAQVMKLLKNTSRRPKSRGLSFTTPDPALITQEIRIGIFVCRCNDALGWDDRLDDYLEQVWEQEKVVHVETLDAACVKEGVSAVIKTVRSHLINRIVLASCVCCPLNFICTSCTDQRSRLKEGLFMATGISRSMVETCNIRGEALNLMTKDKELAVARFKGLINRTIKRAQHLKSFAIPRRNYNFTIGVIGESEASVTSALMLAQTGEEVLMFGAGKNPLSKTPSHSNIQAFKGSLVKTLTGTLGNFQITVNLESDTQTFHVGAVILEHRLIRQIKYIHQEGLSDRKVLTAMQKKNIPGMPFILPGMTSIAGLFLADPPGISVSKKQKGEAAAIHVAASMPRQPRQGKGYTVRVNPLLCRGCGRCIDVCSYQAAAMNKNSLGGWVASVDEAFCKGCGNCIAVCPTNAVDSPLRDHVFLEQELEEILA